MQLNHRFERGQTLPFWAIGTLMMLGLLFFLANYVTAVNWQVHAQNAADSAASAMLSVQANVWNEESTLLYTAAVDENRLRYLNQAILNTIAVAGQCDPSPGESCDQDYQTLVNEYNVALNGFTDDV
ncbi:MAG TPA: pilus assembly protein TadG-related protein, partial [Candidatus Baltobacteraceae bacterium]|nr:pilus assembly protein TadG-related protein [Candidatus Baltobacteraceae bacterium]